MKEFEYPSRGAGMIHAYRWDPKSAPVGVVQLVHGVAEHVGRYERLAQYFNEKGLLVVGEDHMGHGKSHGMTPLHFVGGWKTVVEDTFALYQRIHEEFPNLPYFLYGHSMGSFLTRSLLFLHPEMELAGVVLCGTGWQPAPVLATGRAICALECKRLGEETHSPLMEKLMFGAYNSSFKPNRTPNDWICASAKAVDAYNADPLCGGKITVGLAQDMLAGLTLIQNKTNLQRMRKTLPVHFIAGEDDPVGAMGKGVKKAFHAFQKAGMTAVSLRLFPGRHEIHQEENYQEVYDDVWNFLEKLL